jgi:hypothetical protein
MGTGGKAAGACRWPLTSIQNQSCLLFPYVPSWCGQGHYISTAITLDLALFVNMMMIIMQAALLKLNSYENLKTRPRSHEYLHTSVPS